MCHWVEFDQTLDKVYNFIQTLYSNKFTYLEGGQGTV